MADKTTADNEAAGPINEADFLSYTRESRRLGLSIPLVLPLLVIYQVGIVRNGSTTRNVAEVWITNYLADLNVPVATIVNILIVAGLAYALWELQKNGRLLFSYMIVIIFESCLYALLLMVGVSTAACFIHELAMRYLSQTPIDSQALLLSIGAGVYEELLFRLILIGGGMLLLKKLFMWGPVVSGVLMISISALLFSAAHHLGPGSEPVESYVFIFRAVCGAVLGTIFVTRGLGIAVFTHVIYNVLLLVNFPG
ncbi:MAG: CPBP family intramembrane metalloprotease [Planctomycetes bacterium]|nr:CPBP family intramembrane metalloprotease [Planctomycetota bacterium]